MNNFRSITIRGFRLSSDLVRLESVGAYRWLRSRSHVDSRQIASRSIDGSVAVQHRQNNTSAASNKPRLSAVIVGAGPSGFYTAKYLSLAISKLITANREEETSIQTSSTSSAPFNYSGIDIDIVERLPTPYGLVRYGVAPDHPEVKNVENDFASVAEGHSDDMQCTISYFGNVDVGRDLSLEKLSSLYDIVVLAYGCQSDRNLGIPGLELKGVLSAREFVNWYNGHPEFGSIGDVVQRCLWPDGNNGAVSKAQVVVIGNGNVALDCARVLVKGKPGLESTDTPSSVLDVLGQGVKKVTVAGRRGHVQGAFTIKELRELTKLKKEGYNASFQVRQDELDMGMTESSVKELNCASGRPKKRIDALLHDAASLDSSDDGAPKMVELRLLLNPTKIESRNQNADQVSEVVFERTKLQGEPGKQQAVGTGETETIPADLVIVSVGYKGEPLEGMSDSMFDKQSGVIANNHGKVSGDNNIFATGWIKRGPSGIIGTNITDTKDTVASIMKYITSECQNALNESPKGRAGLIDHIDSNGTKTVTWDQYLQIDQVERDPKRLRNNVQPREKILSIKEMLDCLQKK